MAVLDSAELVLRANRYSGSGDWLDESGNGHHAVPTGSPTWDGEKFTLDGSTQYFTVPHSTALEPGAGSFTVVGVVTPDAAIAANSNVFGKRAAVPSWWNVGWQNANKTFYNESHDGTTARTLLGATNAALPGNRRVVSWRVDRNAAQHYIRVDSSETSQSYAGTGAITNTVDLTIGRAFGAAFFPGDIYGVAIFTTALSDADVDQAGAELVAPPPTPGGNRMGGTGAIRKPPRY